MQVEESSIRSPLIYHIQEDGKLARRIKAEEMKLVKNSWTFRATRVQNDGQRVFLGDVMLPTGLKLLTWQGTLPPKTVSIYKLPIYRCSKARWFASQSASGFFHHCQRR